MLSSKAAKLVFIVDDDPSITEVIKIILETNGIKTFIPNPLESVINDVKSKHPSLILLDLWMSGVDGCKVAQTLKSDKQTASVPILVISAHNDGARLAKESGADGYLAKPFDIDMLTKMVEKYLH